MKWIRAVAILFISFTGRAQETSVKGSVVVKSDMDKSVISLLKANDSSIVRTVFSEKDGSFLFEKVKPGKYRIAYSHVGYSKYISSSFETGTENQLVQLPTYEFTPEAMELATVSVVGKKQFIEQKIDRVVVNPEFLIGNAGSTTLEILERAPGILVDIDGNISLKGKSGVLVFVDDKPTYLSAADLAGYLRSLPSGTIESIEIMTNPPAKYEAAGNAGIINIRLKKNRALGYNGSLSLSYGQGVYAKSNNSLNVNYRINKVNYFANIGVGANNNFQDLYINRYYYETDGRFKSSFLQNSFIKKQLRSYTFKMGADFYLNQQSTLGFVLTGMNSPNKVNTTNIAKMMDAGNHLSSIVNATIPLEKNWKNGSVNLNYGYKFKKPGEELLFNFDHIQYDSKQYQSLENELTSASQQLIEKTELVSESPSTIQINTFKIDYSTVWKPGEKFEAGAKSSEVKTDNIADFKSIINQLAYPNYEFSNRFKYHEFVQAVYLNYTRQLKNIGIQIGLRTEHTRINGHQLGNPQIADSSFTQDYTNLFPTMYISYKLDTAGLHQLGFNFGRRIDRPNYQDMNPFTSPLDKYTYYAGNPFLIPSFSYNFEASHTYKNILTTTLEIGIVKNLIQETNEQRGTIYYSRPGNFGRQLSYGISMNANIPIKKWWSLQFYMEAKNFAYNSLIYGQTLNASRFYYAIQLIQQFVLTKDLTAELTFNYQSRILVAQFLTIPVWQLRAGLSQKIMKGKGSLKLNFADPFYKMQPGGDIRNIANAKADWKSYLDTRVITLAFTYRFNKGKSLNARPSGGSDAEKGRVKTS